MFNQLSFVMNKLSRNILLVLVGVSVAATAFADAKAEPKTSIYDVDSKWRDIQNNEVKISVAAGGYVVMGMVYTSCAHACPMIISKMQKIDQALSAAGVKDVKFVLASFDVKKDRPEHLKKYQASRKLDPKKWIFLAAETEADARELAVVLGISYKDLGDGDFSHSNVISLLDKKGVLLSSIDNLNASEDVFVQAVGKQIPAAD